jgi:peptide chain release factor subunit 1
LTSVRTRAWICLPRRGEHPINVGERLTVPVSLPFDIKALSQRYNADGHPAYLTLYADLSDPRYADILRKRQREIRAAMTTQDARQKVDAAMVVATDALDRAKAHAGVKAVVVFVGPEGSVEEHALQAPIPTRLVLDASPYVAPLARYVDDNESFALVLLDSEHAAIFVIWAGKAELHRELATSLIGRHRHGGMSQMRYQRHRQGQVSTFYDHVIEHLGIILSTEGVSRIAVAGPGSAKRALVPRMPKAMQANVALVRDVDFKEGPGEDALVRRFVALMRDEEAKQSAKWAQALQRELAVGELAMTGALECATLAAAGRVERLLVLGGTSMAGAKCEQHQVVFARNQTCHCGSKGADVDLVNEAVEFTSRADGQCEFVNAPDPFMTEAGGVGALLRW